MEAVSIETELVSPDGGQEASVVRLACSFVPADYCASDQLLYRVLQYIHANYASSLTLAEVADRFYTCPSNIEGLFSRKLHCPFYRYVTEYRIAQAQELIRGGMPMKAVGAACGYNDYSNFYRAFTKTTGISPNEFRKRFRQP